MNMVYRIYTHSAHLPLQACAVRRLEVRAFLAREDSVEMPIKALRRASLILSAEDEQMELGEYDLEFLAKLSRSPALNLDETVDSNGTV